jgi:NH3-dependent NAD+ synthetase
VGFEISLAREMPTSGPSKTAPRPRPDIVNIVSDEMKSLKLIFDVKATYKKMTIKNVQERARKCLLFTLSINRITFQV